MIGLKKYPVIKIAFSGGNFRSLEMLQVAILEELRENEKRLGIQVDISFVSARFSRIIKAASAIYRQPVVILIDEYDKPILDNMDQPEEAAQAREELKGLYFVIKANDAYIRFAFLTGVTKFSKVSVFSGINNIEDTSLALCSGEMEQFKKAVHALFAAIPYHNYTNNDIVRYEGFFMPVSFLPGCPLPGCL